MKIGLISTAVPLVQGGYRMIVDWLHDELVERGHEVETIYIPFTEEFELILPQTASIRMLKLDHYFDRVITFRPPAHMVQHPRKVVWFIHHLRAFYDLWQTPYCPVPDNQTGRAMRQAVFTADRVGLGEAHRVFTNSKVVAARIERFNELKSEVLYPPVSKPERFRSGAYGDEIVVICRMEGHKRQHLLVEALSHTRTPVRLRLCGLSMSTSFVAELRAMAARFSLGDRLTIEDRWISEDEKIDRLETALASAYVPFDEDSYGYPTIEAAHAERCTLTVSDSGGVPEFVQHEISGLITDPHPIAVADAMDRLYADRASSARMGKAARSRVTSLGIDWNTVIGKLLA